MGLAPYALPADFASLSPDRQMFILSNLDRIAYSLAPVAGLSAALDVAAEEGVKGEHDPVGLTQAPWTLFWASNWAAFPNAVWGYYMWMYFDEGAGWGHRDDVIVEPSWEGFADLNMGAAAGVSSTGREGSALIIQAAGEPTTDYYTWSEAVAEGTGSNVYNPGVPEVTLTVMVEGTGAGSVTGTLDCEASCSKTVPLGETIKLTATPAQGSVFDGWEESCSGLGACELSTEDNRTVIATFNRDATAPTPSLATPGLTSSGQLPRIRLLHVTVRARTGSARFSFTATNAARTECALVKAHGSHKTPRPRFAACRSPKTYRLRAGRYAFSVRAVGSDGKTSRPAEYHFHIT